MQIISMYTSADMFPSFNSLLMNTFKYLQKMNSTSNEWTRVNIEFLWEVWTDCLPISMICIPSFPSYFERVLCCDSFRQWTQLQVDWNTIDFHHYKAYCAICYSYCQVTMGPKNITPWCITMSHCVCSHTSRWVSSGHLPLSVLTEYFIVISPQL